MNSLVQYAKVLTSFKGLRRAMRISRTCPNCNQQFDLALALHLSGWSNLAPSHFGVRCPNCKMVLAAHQRGGFWIFWVVLAVVLVIQVVGIATGQVTRTSTGLVGLVLGVFAIIVGRWRLQSLIELGLPPPGVALREVHSSARDYAYLEDKDGRERAFQFDSTTNVESGPEWICSNCKEPNPAAFDLCWKCNHGRAARTS
jgi:hypothetical protein